MGKGDENKVTLGIGFTEDGGNLLPVIERYVAKKGVFADQLATYLPHIGKGTLATNKKFHELLKQAGASDPLMAEAQNEQFHKSYLDPAFAWFKKHRFDLPLSFLVIADSYLHSGGIRESLRNSFKESTPAQGAMRRSGSDATSRPGTIGLLTTLTSCFVTPFTGHNAFVMSWLERTGC